MGDPTTHKIIALYESGLHTEDGHYSHVVPSIIRTLRIGDFYKCDVCSIRKVNDDIRRIGGRIP